MHRRSFLKSAGAVTIVVAAGGVYRAYDQGVFSIGAGPAYEPWKNWRDATGGPLALVRAAILAASPHNTQPWRFQVTDSAIDLYLDTRRNVGALDPYLREEHLGIGCALENLLLAAAANGYATTVTLPPGKLEPIPADPETTLVARVDLSPGKSESSELCDAIPRRHTNRAPYDPQRPLLARFSRRPAPSARRRLQRQAVFIYCRSRSKKNRRSQFRRELRNLFRSRRPARQRTLGPPEMEFGARTSRRPDRRRLRPAALSRRGRQNDDPKNVELGRSPRRKKWLRQSDAQRAADRIHRRPRPL